jgi:hypothetical protein
MLSYLFVMLNLCNNNLRWRLLLPEVVRMAMVVVIVIPDTTREKTQMQHLLRRK